MSHIAWTDGIGAATLGNAFIYPGNRFANWNPSNRPFGERSQNLGTGALNVTAFRDDLTVSLDITGIPNSSQSLMLRLEMHLKRGGVVTIDPSPDTTIPLFGDCKLAPGADVQIQLSDKTNLEYTFSTVLRGAAGSFLDTPDGTTEFILWIKADAPAWPSLVLPADLSALSQWNDVTGNGNHATQPDVTAKPQFQLNIQNGLPAVYFNGGLFPAWRMAFPTDALNPPNVPDAYLGIEGFVALRREPDLYLDTHHGGPWGMGSGYTGAFYNTHYPIGTGGPYVDDPRVVDHFGSDGQRMTNDPGINLAIAHIYNAAARSGPGGVIDPNGLWIARFNGVENIQISPSQYGVPGSAIPNTALQVGSSVPDGFGGFRGWIYELIVYHPIRTPTQRAAIHSYLATKWGITL